MLQYLSENNFRSVVHLARVVYCNKMCNAIGILLQVVYCSAYYSMSCLFQYIYIYVYIYIYIYISYGKLFTAVYITALVDQTNPVTRLALNNPEISDQLSAL